MPTTIGYWIPDLGCWRRQSKDWRTRTVVLGGHSPPYGLLGISVVKPVAGRSRKNEVPLTFKCAPAENPPRELRIFFISRKNPQVGGAGGGQQPKPLTRSHAEPLDRRFATEHSEITEKCGCFRRSSDTGRRRFAFALSVFSEPSVANCLVIHF